MNWIRSLSKKKHVLKTLADVEQTDVEDLLKVSPTDIHPNIFSRDKSNTGKQIRLNPKKNKILNLLLSMKKTEKQIPKNSRKQIRNKFLVQRIKKIME